MSNLGLPCRRVHDHDRDLHPFLCQRKDLSADLKDQAAPRWLRSSGDRRQIRRSTKSASGIGALWRARLDAGMMDTVLNLGLNDETVLGWRARAATSASPMTAIAAFADVWPGRARHRAPSFRGADREPQIETDAVLDTELAADDWQTIVAGSRNRRGRNREAFPQDVHEQLWARSPRCSVVDECPRRQLSPAAQHPADWGTAVSVQRWCSATGRGLRDRRRLHPQPSTGANEFYGEYLVNAQGEDVVAGIRTRSL